MSFEVPADAYDRFMGVHSRQLAPQLADLAELASDGRALDVGCGPGALTTELVARLGEGSVAAVDPSETFVAAARERHPGVDVQRASAEALPYPDRDFDAALAQLVVHFMTDPVAGHTRDGASDAARTASSRLASGTTPASGRRLHPSGGRRTSSTSACWTSPGLPGAREGHLVELFEAAGLREIEAVGARGADRVRERR